MSNLNPCISFIILLLAINVKTSLSQFNKPWNDKYESNKCPKLYPKNFVNYAPAGNITAGNYSEKTELKGLRQCVMACCLSDSCNIVFIVEARCFHVECVSDEMCLPFPRVGTKKWQAHVSMILVKPVLLSENWSDILDQSSYAEMNNNYSPEDDSLYSPYTSHRNDILTEDDDTSFLSHFLNNLPSIEEDEVRTFDKYRDNNDSDMIMEATNYLDKVPCDVGANDCPFNSECIPLGIKPNNGICKCVLGTEENAQGACIQIIRPYAKGPTIPLDSIKKSDDIPDIKSDDTKMDISTPKTIQNLTVSVSDKQVSILLFV
ncbi:unnamed protein product [Diatraea saccharalis]|uniref:MANSC domain-containing protein n=1 Tax=Diatraea saccharalis TaxID=40085 RepID=A0A9N9R3K6_9NEOP|nr:unnamed protein product [Diatraea saccharalis]